jgi:uncharacterized repeat protein (TIGR02543 family)
VQNLSSGPARTVETRSARALTLGFDTLDLSIATRDPAAYTLSGTGDPAYGTPQPASRVGGDRQAVGLDVVNQPITETRLHLLLPQPLRPGVDYRLDACAALGTTAEPTAPCHSIPVRYEPDLVSGSIQVNQVGYATGTTKIAFLGNWLGSAGPLPLDATGFEVVEVGTGETVFSGQARLTAGADPWSGNDVHQADFTALDRPGRYQLRVPGLGVSDPFTIGADVYDAPYRTVMRLFYHSRNSTPVVEPWAQPGFERPAGGIPPAMDAAFHPAVATSPLSAGSTTNTGPTARHPVGHGWFNAGDLGQYVPNAAPLWYQVGAALDLAPGRFGDGDFNIPESGNGIPDILDELEWGLDWLLGMQDPADGGVWFRVASRTWDEVPPQRVAAPRLIAEKTSHATAAFAAACALHARLIAPYRPERATTALAAARRAWDFLASHADWPAEGQRYQNPADVRASDYSDVSVRDNRLWAAAELYRTTGEAAYRTAFEALMPTVKVDPTGGGGLQEYAMAGFWAYLLAPAAGKNTTLMAQARAAIIAGADWRVRQAAANPFRAPLHSSIAAVGGGSFALASRATLPLLQAYRLSGKTDYLDQAWQGIHPQLGANPQSLSYLTGFGTRSPRFPLTRLTKGGIPGNPLPGIPVPGPQFTLSMPAFNAAYLPPERIGSALPTDTAGYRALYPALRRYADARGLSLMSEPTVADYARVGIAFGLLRRDGLKEEIDATSRAPADSAHQLTVVKDGAGSGTVGGGGRYPVGTRVQPIATPADGSALAGWTPASCGSAFAIQADTTCTTTFILPTAFNLTVKFNGIGAVTSVPAGIYCGIACTKDYPKGVNVALTPTPAIGYRFEGWSGACTDTGACSVTMGAAKTVTATFKPIDGYVEGGITASLTDTAGRQVQPLGAVPARYVETRSDRALTMGFDTLDLTAATADPSAYTLRADGDPNYGSPRPASRVGGDRQTVGFDAIKRPQIESRLHLLFPSPLSPGVDYRLDACAALDTPAEPQAPCHTIPVRYDPTLVSSSIQVDQVGYAPDTTKIAFLGNWLGTAGPLPLDSTGFEVIDNTTGETVFNGQARLTAAADPWSGNNVYQADFTALDRPGRYRLRVPGLGVSDPFAIAANLYDAPYRAVMRLFYHSRNSTPVVAPWAEPGYERPQGGVPPAMDAAFHSAVAGSPLSAGSTTDTGPNARHPIGHGWFDAGDYGQYVPNAAPVWYQVGAAFDLAPQRFGDGDLNIPESGNGIPDVLDELDWGLDWLLGMQDPADGGVWFRVTSRTWDSVPPYLIAAPRLLAEKTSHATAAFAAACALHARLIEPYRPERAATALAAARRAWDFLTTHPDWPAEGQLYKNPTGVNAGDYSDPTVRDNRLWAAAELYRTTGETGYRDAFEALLPQVKIDPTRVPNFREFTMAGLWAYLLAPAEGRNATSVTQARNAFIAGANWRVTEANDHPFRAPTHHAMGLAGWGSFGLSTRTILPLLQGYRLTGRTRYLDLAWQSPHPQLGANPQSLSYLTGFGARSPHFPMSKLTRGGVPGTPIQGIPVYGPHFHLPALWTEMTAVNTAYLPPEMSGSALPTDPAEYLKLYPVLRRYTDARGLPPMSEPTVSEYAQVGLGFGLLRRAGLKEEIDALGLLPP